MKGSRIVVYVYLLLSSCVTPYEVTTAFQPTFVVDGMITDQPGPYVVHLSYAIPVDNQLEKSSVVQGATVIIQDDQGLTETLEEKSPGSYYTTSYQGVVGRSYFITITTSDGTSYQSAPEKLTPVGDFTNLRFEFVQNESDVSNKITSTNGFNVFLDSEVLPEQESRVLWRWTGTFHIYTFPSLHTKAGDGKDAGQIKDPPYCAGDDSRPCTCCDCWVTEYNQTPIISDSKFVNNGKVNGELVAFVEANRRTFYEKYHLSVDQLSVSQAVYDFWKTVKQQKSNSSNLFQTPPPKTKGNIVAISSGAIPAIGYFGASAIKTHSIEMTRADVPYRVPLIDTLKISCTQAYKNSSATKPIFW
jgi:hypothetical protein